MTAAAVASMDRAHSAAPQIPPPKEPKTMTERVTDAMLAEQIRFLETGQWSELDGDFALQAFRELQSHRRTASAGGEGVEAAKELLAITQGDLSRIGLIYEKLPAIQLVARALLTATAEGERMAEKAAALFADVRQRYYMQASDQFSCPHMRALEEACTAFKGKGGGK